MNFGELSTPALQVRGINLFGGVGLCEITAPCEGRP